jgi:hypothetical protein
MLEGRLCDTNVGLAEFALLVQVRIRTAKVFSRRLQEKTSRRGRADEFTELVTSQQGIPLSQRETLMSRQETPLSSPDWFHLLLVDLWLLGLPRVPLSLSFARTPQEA